jgi:DNA-binding GntR family transcriptional regulator
VSTPTTESRIPRELLADRAYADLRDRIVTLQIAPGAPIDEDVLGGEINITDLADISDVRMQLEGHAAYRAAQRITPAQRAELQELEAELDRSQGSDDIEALMALDTRVHRFIHRCAGNPYLQDSLGRYFNLSLRIWYLVLDRLPHLFTRVHEHAGLLKAIEDGDAEGARAIIAEHIETFEREIRAVL